MRWQFAYDGFGREESRTDPDGYVHAKAYAAESGLLEKTYTYLHGGSGEVVKQVNYTYADGRLSTIMVADDDGAFPLDGPAAWITSTYGYDDYGRVTSKTITPGGRDNSL